MAFSFTEVSSPSAAPFSLVPGGSETPSTLAHLARERRGSPGRCGTVLAVSDENPTLCNKLLAMGIVSGTKIEVLSVAPLGDPIKIRALGYKLSLRLDEACCVHVHPDR